MAQFGQSGLGGGFPPPRVKHEDQVQLGDSSLTVHTAMDDHDQGGGYAEADRAYIISRHKALL